jgi:hypothetical protein
MRGRILTRRYALAIVAGAALLLTLGVGSIIGGPTRGPIPDEAFSLTGGPINRDLVPDYIPALGPDGAAVGWVSKELAIPVVAGDDPLIPVFADDLRTVVGHMVAGHGYVAVGTDIDALLQGPPGIEMITLGPAQEPESDLLSP